MIKNIVFFICWAFYFVIFIVFPVSKMLEKYLHKIHADDDILLSISIGGNEMDAKEAAEVLANAFVNLHILWMRWEKQWTNLTM